METNEMIGFPLNKSFTEVKDIVELVKSTKVHDNYNKKAQFALAVLVVPYANNVCSVWVYIASLVSKR